jgi:hypothetical protein
MKDQLLVSCFAHFLFVLTVVVGSAPATTENDVWLHAG